MSVSAHFFVSGIFPSLARPDVGGETSLGGDVVVDPVDERKKSVADDA